LLFSKIEIVAYLGNHPTEVSSVLPRLEHLGDAAASALVEA
jgi:hypothetical protein